MSLKIGNNNIGIVVRNEGGVSPGEFSPEIVARGMAIEENTITVYDALNNKNIRQIKAEVVPTQAGTGIPSVSNPREIIMNNKFILNRSGADKTEYDSYQLLFPNEAGNIFWFSLDITSQGGTLTVTPIGYVELDGVTDGKKAGGYSQNNYTAYVTLNDGDVFGRESGSGGVNYLDQLNGAYMFCNRFQSGTWPQVSGETGNSYFGGYISSMKLQARFCFETSLNISDVDGANAYFKQLYDNGTPVRFTYPLANATPTVYQLTAEQVAEIIGVQLNFGENNVWINYMPESFDLYYVADTKPFVENNVANSASPTKIKVCEWNTHQYTQAGGNIPPNPDAVREQEIIDTMKPYLIENGYDLMITCEDVRTFAGLSVNVNETVYETLFPYCKAASHQLGIKSKMKIFDYKTYGPAGHFPTPIDGSYEGGLASVRTLIGGRNVLIMAVHMTTGATETAINIRTQQYADLINIIKDEEYVIMAGDFNPSNEREQLEFNRLIDLGYRAANCGYFGVLKTISSIKNGVVTPARPCDNIFTTPNIIMNKAEIADIDGGTYSTHMSDHRPIYAEIVIS